MDVKGVGQVFHPAWIANRRVGARRLPGVDQGSDRGLTVTTKLVDALSPSWSSRIRVPVELPAYPEAGCRRTVRFPPTPPIWDSSRGSREGFDDRIDRRRAQLADW